NNHAAAPGADATWQGARAAPTGHAEAAGGRLAARLCRAPGHRSVRGPRAVLRLGWSDDGARPAPEAGSAWHLAAGTRPGAYSPMDHCPRRAPPALNRWAL